MEKMPLKQSHVPSDAMEREVGRKHHETGGENLRTHPMKPTCTC